jgi:hypothetical protein
MPSKIDLASGSAWAFSPVQAGRLRRCSSGGFYLPSKRERGSWDCCGNAISPATCINRGWSSAPGLPRLIEAFSRDAPSDRSPGWPSLLWVERLRTYALEHFGDDLQHVCRRKGPQRFRADVAQCAEAQVKRRSGKLIWSFNDYYDVIPSLRPEYVLYGHPKRLRHLPEGLCSLRRLFSVFDALIGEPGEHDIGCHGRFP